MDAAEAAAALGLADRGLLHEGPAATLLHSTDQRRVFDTVFDLYFRDSAAPEYAEPVAMHECRSAHQLGALIDRLLPG